MSTNPTYVPQYGNTPAGGALDPTYFDTNSSNPKNIGKPKGTPGWQFLGWMWQDDDGTRHYNFDYYDDLGNLVKSAEEFPSVITNRSYTFTAMWAPSEVTVYPVSYTHLDVYKRQVLLQQGVPDREPLRSP